jgi:DNA-directed RNA polymerase subunit RPC12/RpoP
MILLIKCKYRCQRCGHDFERRLPGAVNEGCPRCHHQYVDWLNSSEVLMFLHKFDPDFKHYPEFIETKGGVCNA